MRKIMDIICLVGWSISLEFGILAACGLMTIAPIAYICAVLCLCLHYAERLMRGDYL